MDLKDSIQAQKANLENFLDPDFGILDKLLERRALTRKDISKIKASSDTYDKNSMLLDYILEKGAEATFLEALKSTNQTHVANFIIANGENEEAFDGDWPLTDREIAILDSNQGTLVDLIDTCDLLNILIASKVINSRQLEFISSKSTNYEKNEAFLDILRRRSLNDYRKTIECLIATNQRHIAEVLDEGGVVLKVHANLDSEDVDADEEQLAASFANQLGDRSLAAANRIWELTQLKIIAAKRGQSIVLYILCKTPDDLTSLSNRQSSGKLKDILKVLFNKLLALPRISNVATKLSVKELENGVEYFNEFHSQPKSDERDTSSSCTTIDELPLELLDIILQKSYLCSTLNKTKTLGRLTDKVTISQLAAVKFCWFQRITKRRLKNVVWHHLKEYHKHANERIAFYRNNRTYLEQNIRLQSLIPLLRSADCLTDVQATIVSRQRELIYKDGGVMPNGRNAALLLGILRKVDEARLFSFIRCLRQDRQKFIARVTRSGGVVVKVEIKSLTAENRQEAAEQLVGKLNDLHDRTKPWRSQVDEIISQLKDYNIEILHSVYDKEAVVWIWCQTTKALDRLRELDQSKTLVDSFKELTTIPSDLGKGMPENAKPTIANVEQEQLKKTVVLFTIVVNFTSKLDIKEDGGFWGVTKLKDKIHVLLSRPHSESSIHCVILVFDDQIPFILRNRIEVKDIECPCDVVSNKMENSLYVLDSPDGNKKRCVWKIKEEDEGDQKTKVTRWLEFQKEDQFVALAISMTSDGELLVVSRRKGEKSHRMMIFGGPDADLHHIIPLPKDIERAWHAVKTTEGNFLILHATMMHMVGKGGLRRGKWQISASSDVGRFSPKARRKRQDKSGLDGEMGKVEDVMFVASEVSEDGKTIVRRFLPKSDEQELRLPSYLSGDSFDRVFVADPGNDRVVLMDSDLQWTGIVVPTELERRKGKKILPWSPRRLFYDEEKKQLIVGGGCLEQIGEKHDGEGLFVGSGGVHVYTFS